jgi:hypothetical protein
MAKKRKGLKYVNKNDPKYIEEQRYLKRWNRVKSAPSLFEKIDKDAVFESALKGRTGEDGDIGEGGGSTMGNRWGIGKPKAPH